MLGDDQRFERGLPTGGPETPVDEAIRDVHASLRELLAAVEVGGSESQRLEDSRKRADDALARLQGVTAELTEEEREPLRDRVRGAARLSGLVAAALERERARVRKELSKTRRAADLVRSRRLNAPPGGSCDIAG